MARPLPSSLALAVLPHSLGALALGAFALGTLALGACVSQPRRPAYGRPLTCPENRLPDPQPGGTSPDAVRCSYDDALGASVVHITGRVLLEQEVGPGIGVGEVKVRIVRLGTEDHPDISDAKTDPQGNYRLSGAFEPGDYVISIHDEGGNVIAHRRFEITPKMTGALEDLTVWVPLDPRLRVEPEPMPNDPDLVPHQPPPATNEAAAAVGPML